MNKIKQKIDPKILLSTLWIFVTLNYIYCDILGLMDSNILSQFLTGTVDGMVITESFLFYGSILMEIPIAMVLLSRILGHGWNRWLNFTAALIKTVAMVMTLTMGSVASYYAFFAVIEIGCTIFIMIYALRWKKQTA